MTVAFITVLMCVAGLFGVECCFQYHGCTFPQVSHILAERSVKAAMDRLEPLRKLNKVFTAKSGHEAYKFAICSSVLEEAGDMSNLVEYGTRKTGDMTGLIMYGTTRRTPPILGRIDYAAISGGKNWLMLEYSNGTNYTSHCSLEGRRARIMITCAWGQKEGVFRFVEENRVTKGCYYLFELEHEAACSPSSTLNTGSSITLNTGSILLIVCFSIADTYLLAGVIRRITSGAKCIYHYYQKQGLQHIIHDAVLDILYPE